MGKYTFPWLTLDDAITRFTDALNAGEPYEEALSLYKVFLHKEDWKEFTEIAETTNLIKTEAKMRAKF